MKALRALHGVRLPGCDPVTEAVRLSRHTETLTRSAASFLGDGSRAGIVLANGAMPAGSRRCLEP